MRGAINPYRGGRTRILPDIQCGTCGNTFRPATRRTKFCSWACAAKGTKHPGPKRIPTEVRFWKTVSKDGPIPSHMPHLGPCWVRSALTIKRTDGPIIGSARFSWELHNGPIPDGLVICHHCDNPRCVRPTHLFLGTQGDNMRDCIQKGRFHHVCGSHPCSHGCNCNRH